MGNEYDDRLFPTRPEYYDPEYGARVQARADVLREKIDRSPVRPDALLADFDRLTGEYLQWARAQELRRWRDDAIDR